MLLTFHFNDALLVIVALVLYGHLDLYFRLVCRHFLCSDKDTILSDMQGRHRFEPHMAVDAGTRVPTTVGLLRVIDLHCHLVFALVFKKELRHVHRKWRVAIVMLTCFLSIHKDLSFLIDTFEMEFNELISPLSILHSKLFSVLSLAGVEPSATSACSALARIGTFEDVPVVR